MRFRVKAQVLGLAIAVLLANAVSASANHNLIQHVSTGPTDQNNSVAIAFGAVADDGSRSFFWTTERLVPADTNNNSDIYQRRGEETQLVSTGPTNAGLVSNATFMKASADGSHVWFVTRVGLVPEDTDTRSDVYERFQGQTRLMSTGPMNFNQDSSSSFQGASPDSTRVFFGTPEQITPDDTDNCSDIYERRAGITTRLSAGKLDCSGGGGIFLSAYADSSAGPRYIFTTSYRFLSADTDSATDVYALDDNGIRLLSDGTAAADPSVGATFEGMSDNGEEVFISTREGLTPDDMDIGDSCRYSSFSPCIDLYEYANGALTLASKGTTGGNDSIDIQTSCAQGGRCIGVSKQGGHLFFATREQLTGEDTDDELDLYDYSAGVTRLASLGDGNAPDPCCTDFLEYRGGSADGTHVFFDTTHSLVPADTDPHRDVYERSGGTTTQVSVGNTVYPAFGESYFGAASDDGTRVFFLTPDRLVASDSNGSTDLYERYNGTAYLISFRPDGTAGSAPPAPVNGVVDSSSDGKAVLFVSTGLATTDTDPYEDLYLASVAPDAYPRPKGATPFYTQLVPAYQACVAPDRAHASPLSFGSCNPPAQTSPNLTVGTPDANARPAKAISDMRLRTVPGDLEIDAGLTDVRVASDLSDYSGDLQLKLPIRLTDKSSADPGGGSPNATLGSLDYRVAIPCAATADTTIGATCAAATSANAIAPGTVLAGKRAIWELGQVQVFDGGADGNTTTVPNYLFMVQGVFAP